MNLKRGVYMELINQTLIMAFLSIIAACSVTFPILFLVQRRKQHRELIETIKDFLKQSD